MTAQDPALAAAPDAAGDRPPTPGARVATLALLLGALTACAVVGFWIAFSSHAEWDDEGYFLLALRAYREGGGLYESIRTVFYGPFYFQLVDALFALVGREPDAAGARWLMIAAWIAALGALGWAASRLARSALAAALAIVLGFPYLATAGNEPLHATSVILLCLAPLVLLFAGPLEVVRVRRAPALAACGALCAAILLVKLNVGVFVALAAASALATRFRGRVAAATRVGLAAALVLLPFVLLRPELELAWARWFAALLALSTAPFALELVLPARRDWGRREAFALAGGYALALGLSLAWCAAKGTRTTGISNAFADLSAFASLTVVAPLWPEDGRMLVSALAIPLAFALRSRPTALALLRVAASVHLFADALTLAPPFRSLPLVWVVSHGSTRSPARTFLGLATLLTSLQAYPIAGSQITFFALLTPFVGAIGFADATRELSWSRALSAPLRSAAALVLALALLVTTVRVNPVWRGVAYFRMAWTKHNVPLGLPGSGPLRLSELEVARAHWLVANLRRNATTFVGVPGVHSLYRWSGVAPPVPFYPHHWLQFRRADEERELARVLLEHERPAVVRNDALAILWNLGGLPDGPVKSALAERFEIAGSAGRYELWLPRTEPRELVLCATRLEVTEAFLARHGAQRAFRLDLPALDGARIARITLHDAVLGEDLLDSAAASDVRRLIVLDAQGERQLRTPGALIADPGRSFALSILWPPLSVERGAQQLFVRVHDVDGRIVARPLFQPALAPVR